MSIKIGDHRDVVVAGGGPAGIIAALAAARNGAKTLLVEQNSFVGGTAVTGLPLNGFHNNRGEQIVKGIPWELVSRLMESGDAVLARNVGTKGPLGKGGEEFISDNIPVRPEAFKYAAWEMLRNEGVELLLHTFVSDVVMSKNIVTGLVIENKSGRQVIPAGNVVDCTGDGDVAFLAGAPFEKGRKPDGKMQPMTMLFMMTGIDLDRAEAENIAFPRNRRVVGSAEWESFYRKADVRLDRWVDELKKEFPHSGIERGFMIRYWGDGVYYGGNMLHIPYYDASVGEELSNAVTEARSILWRLTEFLRKNVPGFENVHLIHTFNIGIRETRRIMGDYELTYEDVVDAKRHEDDVALNGYFVDIHDYDGSWLYIPEKGTQVKDHGAYGIPYRCLLPRDVEGLVIAGRCLSATHEAHSSARVMGTCMAMGEAAGTGASLSIKEGVGPRDVNRETLLTTLENQGATIK